MIEAVNSVLSNAPFIRGAADQVSASRVAQPVAESSTHEVGSVPVIQAPYVSPYIEVNNSYNKAVLQIRDSDTGDVIRQFPSESLLARRAAEANLQAAQEAVRSKLAQTTADTGPAPYESSEGVSSLSAASSSQTAEAAPVRESAPRVEQAQIASAAFASAALTGTQGSSAGFSVDA